MERDARKLLSNSIADELIFVLLGITGGSMYFYTENTALMHTHACNVSFIVCCAPLLTVLLTLIAKRMKRFRSTDGLEDVKLNVWIVIGTIFALTGMAFMIFNGYKFELSPKGDILAFWQRYAGVSTVCFWFIIPKNMEYYSLQERYSFGG